MQRTVDALRDFGLGSPDISVADLTKPDCVAQLGHPPCRIDLLTAIDGVSFEHCAARREIVQIDAMPVPLIGLDDFKTNKRTAGRPKDLADLASLEENPGDKKT